MDGTWIHQFQTFHHTERCLDVWYETSRYFRTLRTSSSRTKRIFMQACVCGRSSQWHSSHSSGWRTARWSTSWSQGSDSPNLSSAPPQCTPWCLIVGPMSRTPDPNSPTSLAPSGRHQSFLSLAISSRWSFKEAGGNCVCLKVKFTGWSPSNNQGWRGAGHAPTPQWSTQSVQNLHLRYHTISSQDTLILCYFTSVNLGELRSLCFVINPIGGTLMLISVRWY